jgi:hypothetical protein
MNILKTKSCPVFVHISIGCIIGFLSLNVYSGPSKDAKKVGIKPATTNSAPVIPLSVFVMPTGPKDGKDPFFPSSIRAYGTLQPKKGEKAPAIEFPLILSGITPSLKLVIVSGKTFFEGEEGDLVINGVRKRIRCLKVKEESAIVELLPEGERRELKMRFGANN